MIGNIQGKNKWGGDLKCLKKWGGRLQTESLKVIWQYAKGPYTKAHNLLLTSLKDSVKIIR